MFRPGARVLIATTLALVTAAGGLYVFAVERTSSFGSDVEERCTVVMGEPFDPRFGQRSLWPPSLRCNAGFDMVPAWVTPALVLLSVGAVVLAGCWAWTASRTHGEQAGPRQV